MKKAILIVGHGSRSKEAGEIFFQVVDMVKAKLEGTTVMGANMELSPPDIPTVLEEMMKINKFEEVIVVPYFLYRGIHIKEDIPEILEEMGKKYEGTKFTLGNPIGAESFLADILISRAKEAAGGEL